MISIHKPPASIELAPIEQALAVTVNPLYSHKPVAYELSYSNFSDIVKINPWLSDRFCISTQSSLSMTRTLYR